MPKTDLKIYSSVSAGGKKITTSVPYINDTTNSATLRQFAQKLNNFTTNYYNGADRVQTIDIGTEEVPVPATPKTEPTLTVGDFTESNSSLTSYYVYDGDGIITTSVSLVSGGHIGTGIVYNNKQIFINSTNFTGNICITASETETYASKTIIITRP